MIRTSSNRANRVRGDTSPPEDPRLRNRPPEPPEEPQVPVKKKKSKGASGEKSKGKHKKLRRIKIEGEKKTKKPGSSSDSNDSDSDSEEDSPISTFTATTRLTLSERFGKMAQWSMDRSNMENMRITKDSAGGALKVMIEEGLDSSSLRGNSNLGQAARRFSYSPAPVGHFPEELSATAPSGIISWDDVRVRYEYYKSCGYLRDLNVEVSFKFDCVCCLNLIDFILERITLNGRNGGTNIKTGLNKKGIMNTWRDNKCIADFEKKYQYPNDSTKTTY